MGANAESAGRTPKLKSQEPGWLAVLGSISNALNRIAAAAAAILLVLMVGLILVEIVLRYFSLSTFMADALVGRGVAAITFLALGWTLEQGSMIRIRVFTNRLSHSLQTIASGFAIVATEALVIWLLYFQWRATRRLWIKGTASEHHLPIPLWLTEGFFLVGLLLLAVTLFVSFLRLATMGLQEETTLKL